MILENFKKILFERDSLLRILMAFIFLSAGIFRIFNPSAAETELIKLGLPTFLTWLILIIEIGGGAMLLIGKNIKAATIVLVLFLIFALADALFVSGRMIISGAGELFVFDATPTDFFMHLTFLVILIFLLLKKNK